MAEWADLLKVVVGAVIGFFPAYFLDRHRERVRRRDEILVQPVIKFLDDNLEAISETYWSHMDGSAGDYKERVKAFRTREASAEARVRALADKQLLKDWGAFKPSLHKVRRALGSPQYAVDKDDAAFEEMGKAIGSAAAVLEHLTLLRWRWHLPLAPL